MKFVTNFRINFVNESALIALPLGVDNMSDIVEIEPEKEIAGDESELADWINEFKRELEPKQKNKIYEILKANGFTTRLKLKLVHEDELNIMFNTGSEALSLGAKTLLAYKLNVLREESPLVSKSKARGSQDGAVDMEKAGTSKTNKKVSTYVFWYILHHACVAVN